MHMCWSLQGVHLRMHASWLALNDHGLSLQNIIPLQRASRCYWLAELAAADLEPASAPPDGAAVLVSSADSAYSANAAGCASMHCCIPTNDPMQSEPCTGIGLHDQTSQCAGRFPKNSSGRIRFARLCVRLHVVSCMSQTFFTNRVSLPLVLARIRSSSYFE